MSGSEVARLRQQIAEEIRAMTTGLSGYAVTAKHTFISRKYSQLGTYHQKLVPLLGEQEALAVVIDLLEKVVE